jgi:hypothetical protein
MGNDNSIGKVRRKVKMAIKYVSIPKSLDVQMRIKEATINSRLPEYAIKNLMVIGALSRTLDGEYDKHVIEVVLPRIVRNKTLLRAILPLLGNKRKQHEFVESVKEGNPFQDYVRKIVESWHTEGKPLKIKDIIFHIRTKGGNHSSYARKCSDSKLSAMIKAIKNKVNCAAGRKAQKETGKSGLTRPKKLHFLRKTLIEILGDHEAQRVNKLNTSTIKSNLNKIGHEIPEVMTQQKRILRNMATEARRRILSNCPVAHTDEKQIEKWVLENYSEREFNITTAYASGRGIAGENATPTLTRVIYKQWFIKELVRKHNLADDAIPKSSTLELLAIKLRHILNDEENVDYHEKASEIREKLPHLIDESAEVYEYLSWADKVLSSIEAPPF